jgi:predicted PurR-regulated permease PerM
MLKRTLRHPFTRLTVCYLVLFFAGTFTLPVVAEAAFMSCAGKNLSGMAPDTIARVQAVLEETYIAERLSSLGLSTTEIQERISSLTAQEREMTVAKIDTIQSGGNGVVGLLILCVLVYFILKMSDKI